LRCELIIYSYNLYGGCAQAMMGNKKTRPTGRRS